MTDPKQTPSLPNMPAADSLPHGLKGLLPYYGHYWDFLWGILLGVVLLTLVILIIRRYLKKRGKQSKIVIKTKMELLSEIESRIRQMSPENPFTDQAEREFFYGLSLSFREYLELRFGFKATDLTFNELREPIKAHLPFDRDGQGEVLGFLKNADLVKFAGESAGLERAKTSKNMVLDWVGKLAIKDRENLPGAVTKSGGKI